MCGFIGKGLEASLLLSMKACLRSERTIIEEFPDFSKKEISNPLMFQHNFESVVDPSYPLAPLLSR
jgi:hypothetical protein